MSDATSREIYLEGLRLLVRSVEAERDEAIAERDQVLAVVGQRIAALDHKLSIIRNMLEGGSATPPAAIRAHQVLESVTQVAQVGVGVSPRKWREDVVRRVGNLLAGGLQMRTDAIYAELRAQGVDFRDLANPQRRLLQILSQDPQFQADRKLGWSLAREPFPSIQASALAPEDAEQPELGKEAHDAEQQP